MATYGRGQMLGSGINPESFKLDYSGFADAAATQARGVANLGASIAEAISEVGDYFKKQKEDEKRVQKSISVAKAIGDLIPGLQPTIQGSLQILNDKEIPLSQRTAEADAIADILNLGINEVRNRQDVGFKERELAIREAEARARNVPSRRSVNLQQGEITETINGKQYKVPTTFDPATGETRRLDGSVVSAGFRDSAIIDTGLNLPMPTAEGTAIPGDGTFPDYGGISDAMALPSRVDPAAIAAAAELTGGQIDVSNVSPMPMGTPTTTQAPVIDGIPTGQAGARMIPPGATPVEVEEKKPLTTSRIVTGQEAKQLGGEPNKKYIIKEVGKSVTDMAVVPPDITPAEEMARQEGEDKKIETGRVASQAIKTIDKFIDKQGDFNKELESAVGYGEKLATGIAKYAPILGTQSPKDRANQKELSILVEKGLLDAAKELKPISNADLKLLLANRPDVTDPPELWAGFLSDLKSILSNPDSYKESEEASTTNKPKTLEEQLDSMIKGNQ